MSSFAFAFLLIIATLSVSGQIDGLSNVNASNANASLALSRSLARRCKSSEAMVRIELDTDRYGWETSWRIVRRNQEVISGPPPHQNYARNQRYVGALCLEFGSYQLLVRDQFGDGLCCKWGLGKLSLSVGADVLAQTYDENFEVTVETFHVGPPPGPIPAVADSDYTVGVYYYPWHSDDFHRGQGYLRKILMPPQLPVLGEYNDRSSNTIRKHLEWTRGANVNLWVTSWWGPRSREDNTLKDYIMIHPDLPGTSIGILYETTSRVYSGGNYTSHGNAYTDVNYIAKTYFDNPNYFRIGGRPVLFVYLTRLLHQDGMLQNITSQMRAAAMDHGHDLYIIGDQVMGSAPGSYWNYEPFRLLDGITTYDVYGNLQRPDGYAGSRRLDSLAARNRQWRDRARWHGGTCKFIPSVSPGYNDRGVRFESGHRPLSRRLSATGSEGSLFKSSLENALPLTDSSTGRMILINSWNEWHEDTQIEPVTALGDLTISSSEPLNLTCYGRNCRQSLEYIPYGELYLDILRQATSR
mmetsp:Transcript_32821/g.78408  ORF Transcript_32821/g.78408 Transcript_32821/m.78408 type:complete len:525 (+) Transcript_32821:166-1740(+)